MGRYFQWTYNIYFSVTGIWLKYTSLVIPPSSYQSLLSLLCMFCLFVCMFHSDSCIMLYIVPWQIWNMIFVCFVFSPTAIFCYILFLDKCDNMLIFVFVCFALMAINFVIWYIVPWQIWQYANICVCLLVHFARTAVFHYKLFLAKYETW